MSNLAEAEAEAYDEVVAQLEDWEDARHAANIERERFTLSRPIKDDGRLHYPEKWMDDPADRLELQAAILREDTAWEALQAAIRVWRRLLYGLSN